MKSPSPGNTLDSNGRNLPGPGANAHFYRKVINGFLIAKNGFCCFEFVWPLGIIQTCLLCPFPFARVTTSRFQPPGPHQSHRLLLFSYLESESSQGCTSGPFPSHSTHFSQISRVSESNSICMLTSPGLPPLLPDHPEFQTHASSFPPNVSSSCMFHSHALQPLLGPASRVISLKHIWWHEGNKAK